MGLGRVELPTSPLSGVRSSQLSYRPVVVASCQFSVVGQVVIADNRQPATDHYPVPALQFEPFAKNDFEDKVEHADRLSLS